MEGRRREGHVEEGSQGGGSRYGEIAPGWLRSWRFRKHVVVLRRGCLEGQVEREAKK